MSILYNILYLQSRYINCCGTFDSSAKKTEKQIISISVIILLYVLSKILVRTRMVVSDVVMLQYCHKVKDESYGRETRQTSPTGRAYEQQIPFVCLCLR